MESLCDLFKLNASRAYSKTGPEIAEINCKATAGFLYFPSLPKIALELR